MHERVNWIALILLLCMVGGMIYFGIEQRDAKVEEVQAEILQVENKDLILWYTDAQLTDYLNSAALSYKEKHDIKVTPILTSGVEYLENINKASLHSEAGPDLYITGNDNLLKAYLAGLATQIKDEELCTEGNFPLTALKAVTYKDMLVAYPFYYETSFLLFNKTYMTEVAKNKVQMLTDVAEETQETAYSGEKPASNVIEAAEIERQINIHIPKTIDDILAFADDYDAPEAVDSVFKWDVSDIFYNYFFAGNYITVGGESGDDYSDVSIYNDETIKCLSIYQSLNQFFSIDAKQVNYDSILQEFLEGKTVFTVATTDAISKLEEAKAAGNYNYEYGVAVLPDISNTLKSRGLSVTNAIVVNGYSEKKAGANDFAKYLLTEQLDTLFSRTGKVASKYNVEYGNAAVGQIMQEYERSISIPKVIETSDFWIQLEIAYTKIWSGNDVSEELRILSEQIGGQIDESELQEALVEDSKILKDAGAGKVLNK